MLQPNPNFIPLLGCYDLTRTGTLPGSDGCPNSTSGPYNFYGHANIRELALFVQDTITKGPWSFNLGLRGDVYNGITSANQTEPRLGIAYNIKPTNTVLRISYARTLETPFNENLVLSSLGCNDAVINAIMSSTISPCVSTTPLTPGWRNEFHAGLQQAFGRYFVLDGEYIWKYTHKAYDFSVLGNTPITFPIEWNNSKIPGLCHPRQHAELPRSVGVHRDVQRGGALLHAAGQRDRRHAGRQHGVPHRPRRELQPDHSPAIPAVEERTVARLQLALRQRPGGGSGAVRGRQLREWAQRDG